MDLQRVSICSPARPSETSTVRDQPSRNCLFQLDNTFDVRSSRSWRKDEDQNAPAYVGLQQRLSKLLTGQRTADPSWLVAGLLCNIPELPSARKLPTGELATRTQVFRRSASPEWPKCSLPGLDRVRIKAELLKCGDSSIETAS